MTNSDFVQEQAYIYDYEYTPEEIEELKRKNKSAITKSEDDECYRSIIVIDILGE